MMSYRCNNFVSNNGALDLRNEPQGPALGQLMEAREDVGNWLDGVLDISRYASLARADLCERRVSRAPRHWCEHEELICCARYNKQCSR